jgi:hypothetical protein
MRDAAWPTLSPRPLTTCQRWVLVKGCCVLQGGGGSDPMPYGVNTRPHRHTTHTSGGEAVHLAGREGRRHLESSRGEIQLLLNLRMGKAGEIMFSSPWHFLGLFSGPAISRCGGTGGEEIGTGGGASSSSSAARGEE